MKKKLLALYLLAAFFTTKGQPIIQNGNNLPAPGLSIPLSVATVPGPGSSGANQTWDFSSTAFTPGGSINVIAPSSSGIGSSYPNANFALEFVGQNKFSFLQSSAGKFEAIAWMVSSTGGGSDYSPNQKTVLKYPFHYQDTVSDTWQKVGGPVNTVLVTYDAYGTVITPTASYTNVVRIEENYGGTSKDYQWFLLNPLMLVLSYNHSNNQLIHFGLTQLSSVKEQGGGMSGIRFYPNPASERLHVQNIPIHTTVTIKDILGKVCYISNIENEGADINTAGLPEGVYILGIENGGQQRTEKLVITR